MDSALVASSTNALITSFKDVLGDNFAIILTFTAAIVVFGVFKKYFFGGAHRV